MNKGQVIWNMNIYKLRIQSNSTLSDSHYLSSEIVIFCQGNFRGQCLGEKRVNRSTCRVRRYLCVYVARPNFFILWPPWSLHVQACLSWRRSIAMNGVAVVSATVRRGTVRLFLFLSPFDVWVIHKNVSSGTAFTLHKLRRNMTASHLLLQITQMHRRRRKKTFLLNEAINNGTRGTSVNEQILCPCLLSLISHSPVSYLQRLYRWKPCKKYSQGCTY